MNFRESVSLLWEAKGATSYWIKKKKIDRPRCSSEYLRVDVTQARCDSAPELQDYKQNLKQFI